VHFRLVGLGGDAGQLRFQRGAGRKVGEVLAQRREVRCGS
jgi:hypothetical protein